MSPSAQVKQPTDSVIIQTPSSAAHCLREGRVLVCIIRHGQTDWNRMKKLQGREDIPLNDTGREQARRIAEVLKTVSRNGVSFSAVCTSPLSRAAETAAFISSSLGLPDPVPVGNLIERDYGPLSGTTVAERKLRYPNWPQTVPEVEAVPSAAARMIRAIDEMTELSGHRTVIGVTHGGITNAVLSRLSGGELGTGKTLTVNCSISCIAAGIGEPVPLAFNLQDEEAVRYLTALVSAEADI